MLPPVIERELRVSLLRRKARKQWMAAAWTAGGATAFFLLVLGLAESRTTGRTLFHWLFGLACYGVVSRAVGLTADLFSEERRNGTLGLLVLTGMSPMEIFASKLVGALLLTIYSLLGGLPFFAIPFVAGGVTLEQFGCALMFLVNALLFCTAMGLLASVVHRDGGQAQVTAMLVIAALCLGLPIAQWLGSLASGEGWLDKGWLTLSPAYAPYQIITGLGGRSSQLFWLSSGITLGYSITALILAAIILQRTWRDTSETVAPQSWHDPWREWFLGSARWRLRMRALLDRENPFCWLAARDRWPVLVAKGFVVLLAAVWLSGLAAWGSGWLSMANFFLTSIVLNEGLNWILAQVRQFSERFF